MGISAAQMAAEMEILEAVLRENGAEAFSSANGDDLNEMWNARRGCVGASMAFHGSKVYFTDGCLPTGPLSKVPRARRTTS